MPLHAAGLGAGASHVGEPPGSPGGVRWLIPTRLRWKSQGATGQEVSGGRVVGREHVCAVRLGGRTVGYGGVSSSCQMSTGPAVTLTWFTES